MNELLKIENFNGGMIDSAGEGKQPGNTFADSRNLVPTKTGSLETVHGFSTTGGLATLPSAFPQHLANGSMGISSILAEAFPFSSELPTAYDGRAYFVRDNVGSPANHVMLDKWFKGSESLVSTNDGFVFLDERRVIPYTGVFTDWTEPTAYTIQVANASNYGLSTTSGYYSSPPWRLQVTITDQSKYATITGYTIAANVATFTVMENLTNLGMGFALVSGDTITIKRWFHSGFVTPDFGTIPGQCFGGSGRVRGCGGPSSNSNYVPWISQYINRTFFNGHASEFTYQGTYADIMQCAPIMTPVFVGAEYRQIASVTAATATPRTPIVTGSYSIYYSLEYDDYEEGELYLVGDIEQTGSQMVVFDIFCPIATLNKRVTGLNLYMSENTKTQAEVPAPEVSLLDPAFLSNLIRKFQTTTTRGLPYFVRRYDFLDPTSTQLDATYGWKWDAANYKGCFSIEQSSGTNTNASFQVRIDGSDWSDRGASYLARTNRVPEMTETTGLVKKTYVVWQYTENVAGRQFFADFYDPNTQTFEKDTIRWTDFNSESAPTPDTISTDVLFGGTTIAAGDPSSVKGLIEQNGWLHIFKDSSIYGIQISPSPDNWVRYTISKRDGLYSTRSLGKLPDGNGIFFGDVDHFKMIHNQRITPLTHTLANTYYNLTNKSTVRAWFDKIDRAVCFSNGASTTHYRGYLDMMYKLADGKDAFPWFKVVMSAHTTQYVSTERDGSIIFVYSGVLYKWHKTDFMFGSQQITPYWKSNTAVSPTGEVLVQGLTIWKPNLADTNALDVAITIDGTAYTWSSQDKTKRYLKTFLPVTTNRTGRKFFVEYNTNAAGEFINSAKIELGGIFIHGVALVPVEASA